MMFQKVKTRELKGTELAGLVRRAQDFTRGSYDLYDRNYDTLFKLCKRILQLSKQEGEWYVYFYAIYATLYLNKRQSNYREVVRYAEIYYKDSALYMDRELPNYPDTDMPLLNIYIYALVFEAYYEYYQIDDPKMEVFMKQYGEAAQKYGRHYDYCDDELSLALLYWNFDKARAAAHRFLEYEREIVGCYVCAHLSYLEYLVFSGQTQQAEELMLDLIRKNIPQRHQWCYQYCEMAEPVEMYLIVLDACMDYGKTEEFRYFYGKYWRSLPRESKWQEDCCISQRLLCAYDGCFDGLEGDLRTAEKIIDDERTNTTVDIMKGAINWWCYFILLYKGGVHKVEIRLPGLDTDEEGKASSLEVSAYMEKKADEYGRKFAKARAGFHYEPLKESYRKCLLGGGQLEK